MTRRVIAYKEHQIELDLTSLRLGLDMPEPRWASPQEPALVATPLDVHRSSRFVSASMLALKCKQVDDRIYAAVELAAQGGTGGKRELLVALGRRLADQAPAGGAAPEVIFAAVALGGEGHRLDDGIAARIRERITRFLADPLVSKPIGFYTGSDELTAIFRQDRMLQTPFGIDDAAGIARVTRELHRDPALRASYERTLSLVEKITNPLVRPDLRPLLAALDRGEPLAPGECSFLPPSLAHETELIKQLFADRPIPQGFDLAEEIARRVGRGALSLAPRPTSGWYDYQTWATEPLLLPVSTPEATHLQFETNYRRQLRELWKGIVALQRETHIKQLEIPRMAGSAHVHVKERKKICIRPELTLEPTCEHYRRRVLCYRFVRTVVTQAFGAASMSPALTEELDSIEALCAGAYATACSEIGLSPDANVAPDPDAASATFARFRDDLGDDPDLGRDARMMVPLFHDLQRGQLKVWAFLGWAAEPLTVSFARRPKVQVLDGEGRPDPDSYDVTFASEEHPLMFPVTAEVYVSTLLDRAEFRRHCDAHRTRTAILANLH